MKKIMIMSLFIVILFSYSVYSIEYPLEIKEWGNPHYEYASSATRQVDDEEQRCFDITMLKNGYLSEVNFPYSDLNAGEQMAVSFSYLGAYVYPFYPPAEAYFLTETGLPFVFGNTETYSAPDYDGTYKNFYFYKDSEIRMCIGGRGAGHNIDIYLKYIENYPRKIENIASSVPSFETTERIRYNNLYGNPVNFSNIATNTGFPDYEYSFTNGDAYLLQELMICQKEQLLQDTDDDFCYFPFVSQGTQAYVTNGQIDNANEDVGQWFKWIFDDNSVEEVNVMAYGGINFNNKTQKARFMFFESDEYGNVTNVLYSIGKVINLSGVERTPYKADWFNFTFPSPITLEENHYYGFGIGGTFGVLNSFQLGTNLFNFDNKGFFGNSSTIWYNNSNPRLLTNDIAFKITLTDNVAYQSDDDVILNNCEFSPYSDCLFYDDFIYTDNIDLYTKGYTGQTTTFFINDEILYANANQTLFNYLDSDLEVSDYDYSQIESIYTFIINDTITPLEMDLDNETTQYIIYKLVNYCGSSSSNFLQLNFFRFLNYSGDLYKTLAIPTVFENGKPRQLGTLYLDNGNKFDLRNVMDFQNKIGYITAVKDNIFLNYNQENSYNLDSNCKVDSFRIIRDGAYIKDDTFIGIDTIAYNGLTSEGASSDFDYIYGNGTTQEDAYIKGEAGEYVNDWAFNLGFKTTASKLMFWLIVLIILSLLVSQIDASTSIKGFAVGFVIILGIIGGWYWKFVPTSILAFLILIVAIIGALVYYKMFASSGEA